MLIELRIKDFAIIHQLKLSFNNGLITFTGETGAGKSIILDAIMALLGGRADNELIRTSASTALVEATFNLSSKNRQEITNILENESLTDEENPEEVILSRELRSTGRSIARINGRSVSVGLLRQIGSLLVDIHGQSDHLSLLNDRNHLPLLDRYTDNAGLLKDYRSTYRKLISLRKELGDLRKSEDEAARQKDFLTFQINEIQNARLSPGEDDELRQERDRLSNAEKLAELTQQCLILLEGGGEETPSTAELLGQLARLLGQLSRIDASQAKLLAQVEESIELLNDATAEMQDYQEQVEYNPRRLVQGSARLNTKRRCSWKNWQTRALSFHIRDGRQLKTCPGVLSVS
jgi:DNA repair protein RecN (Recombination protein N)